MKKQINRFLVMFLAVVIAAGMLPTTAFAAGESYGNYTPTGVYVSETTTTKADDASYITIHWTTENRIDNITNDNNIKNSYLEFVFQKGTGTIADGGSKSRYWSNTSITEDESGNQVLRLYFTPELLEDSGGQTTAHYTLQMTPGTVLVSLGEAHKHTKNFGGKVQFYRGKSLDDKSMFFVNVGNVSGYTSNLETSSLWGNVLWDAKTDYISMNNVGLAADSVKISANNPLLPKGQTVSISINVSALTELGTDAAHAYTGAANSLYLINQDVYVKVANICYTGTDYGDSVSFSESNGKLYMNVKESIYDKIEGKASIELPLKVTLKQTLTDAVTGSPAITLTRPRVARGVNQANLDLQWLSGDRYYRIAQKAKLTANEGYQLPDSIKVTVGDKELTVGTDYTYAQDTGIVNILASSVTDGITIFAYADKKPVPLGDINTALQNFSGDIWYNQDNSTLTTKPVWTVSASQNGTFSNTITLDGEGSSVTKTLYFKNGDILYSYELTYKRDITAPAISEISGVPAEGDYNTSAEISFTASDATSGLRETTVTCDDGNDVAFDGDSFTADRNGTYTITVTDNAGNKTIKTVTVETIHTHNYTYTTNAENKAQIIESCICGHEQTATLDYSESSGSYLYTGSAITPVTVTYSSGWVGNKPTEIKYSNNTNAGTGAKGTLTIGGATAAKTFVITPYDLRGAAVTINPASGKFTGLAYAPAFTVNLDGFGTLTEGTDYNVSWNEPELINVGTYRATITGKGNFTGQIQSFFEITNGWNPEVNTEYTVSEPNDSGWLKDDFVITAKQGYKLSLTNTAGGEWKDTLTGAAEGADSKVNFYVKNTADGTISEMATASYKLDKGNPTGKVSFGEKNGGERTGWEEFLHTISFGLFYKNEVTVKAEAADSLSGAAKIEFMETSEEMSLDELQSGNTAWEVFPENGKDVTLEDAKRFIYYIRITDTAGNVTYISTNGAEYDTTVPVISGIENGATYYSTQKVTVADKNIASVKLNEDEAAADITLDGNRDSAYTIVATDKAGNQARITVTMKPIASLADPISVLTTKNVKSSDKGSIEQVKASLQAVDSTDATETEKAELDELIAKCDALLQAISDVAAEIKELTDAVNSYTPDSVKSSNKEDIQDLIERMDALISGDNLTDEEKASLQEPKDKANALIDKINEAADTSETENIQAADDITADNVVLEDKDALEDALKDLTDALEEFSGNYTETEKADLQDKIDHIEEALDVIEKVENVKNLIEQLPDSEKVTLSDEKAIASAKDAYDKLSDYEKTLVDTNKLDKVIKAFEKLSEDTNPPNTGDNTHAALWFVLMLSAAFGAVRLSIYSKKKKVR